MTHHPPEAVEAVARALSNFEPDMWERAVREGWPSVQYLRNKAIALLDQIAPLYREQAAQVADGYSDAKYDASIGFVDTTHKAFIDGYGSGSGSGDGYGE